MRTWFVYTGSKINNTFHKTLNVHVALLDKKVSTSHLHELSMRY